MPDISMCTNDSCIKCKSCYRHIAEPSEFQQSYCLFIPENNTKDHFDCDMYESIHNKNEKQFDI